MSERLRDFVLPLSSEQLRIQKVIAANNRRKGEKRTPEQRAKMGHKRGVPLTAEHKLKLKAVQEKLWSDPVIYKRRQLAITKALNRPEYRALKAAMTVDDWETGKHK